MIRPGGPNRGLDLGPTDPSQGGGLLGGERPERILLET